MRVGVDVGGTNTDAVLMDGRTVVAWTKAPTTQDVSGGVSTAIRTVLADAVIAPADIASVMIGTTHFTNALVERKHLAAVGILRLASPSGEALPPKTGWPAALSASIGDHIFLLRGGYEVDGREIAPLDEDGVREAARTLKKSGIPAIAITSAFAPVNDDMERRAAAIVKDEFPEATLTLSSTIGRIGLIERENAAILNAALSNLALRITASFEEALRILDISAPLYISQNDGTLISAAQAAAYPVMTIGSGPTNSMRGAAFLTGLTDAIVMDVGGTTTDIGVLTNGFPRESSVAVDIGGVRTNFRMPDILAIGLGGGTRVHLEEALYAANRIEPEALRVGPDSVGFRIVEEAYLFGGATLTASDIGVATGLASFGMVERLPPLGEAALAAVSARIREMLEDGIDRMKTSRLDATVLAVGGGAFLIPDTLKGAATVVRPPHAAIANAVGAAIAQVGGQLEQVLDYDATPRGEALDRMKAEVADRVIAAGGDITTIQIVEVEEIFLSYLPGRAAQVRMKAVADLAGRGHAQSDVAARAMGYADAH